MNEDQLNVANDLRAAAASKPDKVALYSSDRSVSYAELDRLADSLSLGLHKIGIRKNDRVCLALSNLPEFAALFYGALRVGAVAAPINPAKPAHDLRPFIVKVHPRAIVTEESFAGEVMSAGPHPSPVFVIGKHPTAR
ncbi:MAG: AMP-binding protein, partial [Acidimicrobiia bacterium]